MKENNNNNGQQKSLTPELIKYVKKRSELRFLEMGPLFMALMAFGLIVITFDLIMMLSLLLDTEEPTPAGLIIATTLLNIPVPFVIVFMIKKKINLYRRYSFVLLKGAITEAKIKSIDNEWNYQINETPRTILDLEIEGRAIRIKTFAPEILDYCSGSILTLIWHGDMPDIIIPVESLNPPKKTEPETYSV